MELVEVADPSTFFKVDRNIRYWRWLKSPKTAVVWIWILASANIEPHDFEGETIQRGELATSRRTICEFTGLTENEVRTALKHLKSTGEITVRLRPKYQVITITSYCKYQDHFTGKGTGRSPAKHRQSTGRSPQSKNIRMEEGKEEKNMCVDTHTPSLSEVEEYFQRFSRSKEDSQKFYAYNAAKGWKIGNTPIKDWHSAADMWINRDNDNEASTNHEDSNLDCWGKPLKRRYE